VHRANMLDFLSFEPIIIPEEIRNGMYVWYPLVLMGPIPPRLSWQG